MTPKFQADFGDFDFSKTTSSPGASLPRVCLVTSELVGPFRNGGIGTSMTGLVELLGAHDADVTVLYTGEVVGDFAVWKEKYLAAGIKLQKIVEDDKWELVGPLQRIGWTNAWHIYQALKKAEFDVIHFNDTLGEGAYCFVAKRLGLAFERSLLTVALHSPTEWILESNGHPATWLGFNCFTGAERLSISTADLLWGPSRYLLEWAASREYKMPEQVFNQQYVIPTVDLFCSGLEKILRVAKCAPKLAKRKPTEIVFFGRLEERKGIRLFANAITKIGPELKRRGISVLFMGKSSSVNGLDAVDYLAKRSPDWDFEWRIESKFDQQQAIAYLQSSNCVAVMPSPVDNSPCTIYEALQFGLPFIASRTGGIPELIHTDDHSRHLFDYTVASLSSLLLTTLNEGISNATPAIAVAENQRRWLEMHRNWQDFLPSTPALEPSDALFTLLVDHTDGADALDASLKAARSALGDRLHKIIVVQRDLAVLPLSVEHDVEIVGTMLDITAPDIISALAKSAAPNVVMLRSGFCLLPESPRIFEVALKSAADVSVPFGRVAGSGATMPVLPISGALAYLEGDYDAGVISFNAKRLSDRMSATVDSLDLSMPYFGLIEQVLGSHGEIWPIPVVLAEVSSSDAFIMPIGAAEAKRTWALTRMRQIDVHHALSVGRSHYRQIWPAKSPAPVSTVIRTVAVPLKRAVRSRLRDNRERGILVIRKLFGRHSPKIIARVSQFFR